MSLLKIKPFSIDTADTFTFANVTVTSNISSGNATLGNLASATYFQGNGYLLTSTSGANVSGQVANALVAGTVYTAAQTAITSLGTLTELTSTGIVNFIGTSNVSLGNVANLHITGGTDGQVLKSSGGGVVTWYTPTAGTGNANVVGSDTQVFFNDNGSTNLGASANLTFNKTTKTLAVDNISANGASLTSLTGSAVVGNVDWAKTSNWSNVANSITGTNVSGNVASAVQAHYANIANAVAWSGVSSTPTTLSGYGITDYYSNTNAGAYLSSYTGSLTAGNMNLTYSTTSTANLGNLVVANYFSGNGSALTGVSATTALSAYKTANGTSNVNIATIDGPITMGVNGTSNVVIVTSTGVNVAGYINSGSGAITTTGNVTGAYVLGNGVSLTNLTGSAVVGNVDWAKTSNWSNIANSVTFTNVSGTPTTTSGYGITDAYSNTNAGAYLTSYSGDLAGTNLTLTGNLIIGGTTTRVNSTVTTVVDPIMEIGGGANGASLSTDDNKDRGLVLHYYSGSAAVDAFIGWDDSNVEFGVGSNVALSSEVVTWNSYGNLRAGYFLGNGSALTGVSATTALSAYKTANGTSNVNIATIDGPITMGVNGTANVLIVTATGANISGTANVSGNLSAGNLTGATYVDGTLTTASQTGITTVGSLTGVTLVSDGNITLSGINSKLTGANLVSATNLTGTLTTASQTAITQVGTLTSLAVSGATNLGAVTNVTITGGTSGQYLKTNGSGGISFDTLPATTMHVNVYTGSGWTMQTLSTKPIDNNYVLVTIGGVSQPRSSWSLGTAPDTDVITFSEAPPNGAIVEVIVLTGGIAGTVGYVYSSISTSTTAISGYRYFIDTTASVTLTLPASPSVGDEVGIIDVTGSASSNNITIARNGLKINGGTSNLTISTNRAAFVLVYSGSTQGWVKTQV